MRKTKPWSQESGASLVSIMVATALFALIAAQSSQGFKALSKTSRKAETAKSARDVENVMLQALVVKYKSYVLNNKCTTPPATYFNNMNLGPLGNINTAPIAFHTVDKYGISHPAEAPAQAAGDLNRCKTTGFSDANILKNSHRLYYCQNITTTPGKASADAFIANRGAFIEVFVKLRNLATDAPVTCDSVVADAGFGMEFYYNLHWASHDSTGVLYDSKVGTLNAAL